jgi:hypothetical protein
MVAVAILSKAAGRVRDWRDVALNLAFPFPESDEATPKSIAPPFCEQCGYPYEHVPDAPFVCSTCAATDWFFAWARAGYLTEGQVLESVVGFKYKDEFFRLDQLAGWLAPAVSTRRGSSRTRSAAGAGFPSGRACGACARRHRKPDWIAGSAGKTCEAPLRLKAGLTLPGAVCY